MCKQSWKNSDTAPLGVQFCPGDAGTVWVPPRSLWRTDAGAATDNLLRIWWYLDEVELQWRALAAAVKFPSIEIEWGKASGFKEFDLVVDVVALAASVDRPEIHHMNRHVGSRIRYSGAADAKRGKALQFAVKRMRSDYLSALQEAVNINPQIRLGFGPGANGSAAACECADLFRHIKMT